MQIKGYGAELEFANILFGSIFRNFLITKSTNQENTEFVTVEPIVVIADRSRIFKNLENYLAQSILMLPLVTIQRTGLSVATNRITNLHNEIKNQSMTGRINYNLYTPSPIDITYQVVLVSRRWNDINQMLGQILPYFNMDIYISMLHPKYSNVQFSSQVVMDASINCESQPEISKDQDEIHTATLTFTYKTFLFGGTDQFPLGVLNPYIAPITKISSEIHMVPYLEVDVDDVDWNVTGYLGGDVKDESDIPNYFSKLEDGKIYYPDYEMLDWIVDYTRDDNGNLIPAIELNEPYGYTPQKGDGLTFVNPRHRLYDELAEITPDKVKMLSSQNYVNQWGLPYQPIETRPWDNLDLIGPTEEELRADLLPGTYNYTNY